MDFKQAILGIICNRPHRLYMPQLHLHLNLTLPTIISVMLTQHKLQTNTVEMEEEARTFIFRQAIIQQKEEKAEKVEAEAKQNYPINLIMTDKFQ